MNRRWSARNQYILALGISTAISLGLFAYGALRNHSLAYNYLPWNLFLAWLPLGFAVWLTGILRRKRWSSWEALAASVLWLLFLPNSFYMISDFIHLQDVASVDVLYDAVMFTSFICTGVALGFSSLYLVHLELRRRVGRAATAGWIGVTLLICSVGVYIGRDLRWNSWDLFTNPGGLLFDMSERALHPAAYPEMLTTVVSFLVLLSGVYFLMWSSIRLLRHPGELYQK